MPLDRSSAREAEPAAARTPSSSCSGALARPASLPSSPPKAARAAGPREAMRRLGLHDDVDLALHLPLRYEDETRLVRIADTRDGETAQIEGEVAEARVDDRYRRQLVVRVDDGSGASLLLRFLHFNPAQRRSLVPGVCVRARGELRGGFLGREMVHPAFRVVAAGTPLAATLTPVYPASSQLPQAYLRKAIASALARVDLDPLWPTAIAPPGLPALADAVRLLHAPPRDIDAAAIADPSHPAWQRLKFEELLAQQLAQRLAREERRLRAAPPRGGAGASTPLRERLLAALPFALTGAQRRAAAEIAADLRREQPMVRLLQGDVGCGKTVVAALAAAEAIDAGWQCALMAPTELLAEQHLRKLVQWLEPLGVRVVWLVGGRRGRAREAMRQQIASGEAALVVGTQAVIQQDVAFANLGLAIVDEQHRFGVEQRLALRGRPERALRTDERAIEPHLLMMTATPIPRTLAMSYFADLDLSTIDELPPGRTPVATKVFSQDRREEVVSRVRDEVLAGRQAYWVCPLIDEADDAPGESGAREEPAGRAARTPSTRLAPAAELRNVVATHRELSETLGAHRVGLLHGRMKTAEKAAVMAGFESGAVGVLVATTVVEVGVDVPNASLMIVEHAERFGLAQLHQLRGRVGRGAAKSVCVLLYGAPLGPAARARLKAMAGTNDGFEIARLDLQIRGPGEFMGTRQSGSALLRFADPTFDAELLGEARQAADALLRDHRPAAAAHLRRWLRGRVDFAKA